MKLRGMVRPSKPIRLLGSAYNVSFRSTFWSRQCSCKFLTLSIGFFHEYGPEFDNGE